MHEEQKKRKRYESLRVLGRMRVVKNDRRVRVVVGGLEGIEMRHGINLHVGLAIVVKSQ